MFPDHAPTLPHPLRLMVFVVLLALFAIPLHAQDAPPTAWAEDSVFLYDGPHTTFNQISGAGPRERIVIEGRNTVGNWLYVRAQIDSSRAGWVQTGFIFPEEVQFSTVPVIDTPDANPFMVENAETDDLALLYDTPIVAPIHPDMREVYQNGQLYGRNPATVARIGDSNIVSELFLTPLSTGSYDLGPYDYLGDTAALFGESFGLPSAGARQGLNAISLFDPMWAVDEKCQPNEGPLACEYRTLNPAYAVIVLGQNDVYVLNRDQFEARLRAVAEHSLTLGIIPIFSTFTNSPDNAEVWPQILAFNAIIIQIAAEYDLPLVNFWLAARDLPDYGIGDDFAHLTAGGENLAFTGGEARHGMTLYNLLVLYTLDNLRRTVTTD